MKNIKGIFEFYLKNRINPKDYSQKVFASMIALAEYEKEKNFDLQTVIKMIMLKNINIEKLTNQSEINSLLEELEMNETYESQEASKCIEKAKNLSSYGIEEEINSIYGRLLLSVGIDIESKLQLEFTRLYERVIRLTSEELENEKTTRLKYCHYNIYDVTEEYAHLISFLEENLRLKIGEIKAENDFIKVYQEQKGFYRSMPILSGVLEKTKKL